MDSTDTQNSEFCVEKTLADDLSSDDDWARESDPGSIIKEMCAKFGEAQLFVEK